MKNLFLFFSAFFCFSSFSFEVEDLIGEWKEMGFVCLIENNQMNLYDHHHEEFVEIFEEKPLFDFRDRMEDKLESSSIKIDENNMIIESKFDTNVVDAEGHFCRARTLWSGSYRIEDRGFAYAVNSIVNRKVVFFPEDSPTTQIMPIVKYPLLVFRYTKNTKFYNQEGCPKGDVLDPVNNTSVGTFFIKFRIMKTDVDQQSLIFIPSKFE